MKIKQVLGKNKQTNKQDFPGGLNSKESACNAGDPGSIPGSGRSPGEGNSYLLRYPWRRQWQPTPVLLPGKSQGQRSLVGCSPKSWAQLSDFTFTFHFHALEKEMATHSSVLAWRIPGMEEPGGLLPMGSHRVRHD